ncbi:hypothetical protein ACQ4PT_062137 [Festuca glaucescens]
MDMVRRMTRRLTVLEDQGLKGIHMVCCWAARGIAPLKRRPNLLCDYMGSTDLSRTISIDCLEEEFVDSHLRTWTSSHFISLDAPSMEFRDVAGLPLLCLLKRPINLSEKNTLVKDAYAKELADLQEKHLQAVTQLEKDSAKAVSEAKQAQEQPAKELEFFQKEFADKEKTLQLHFDKLEGQLKETDKAIQAAASHMLADLGRAAGGRRTRTDTVLLKFLRAREFKVKEAMAMLKAAVLWRKNFGIDALLDADLGMPELENVVFYCGADREGHPIYYNVCSELWDKKLYKKAFGDNEKRKKTSKRGTDKQQERARSARLPEGKLKIVERADCRKGKSCE